MDTKDLGNLGERIACEYLVKKGYKILAKNYRISFGEIDIIAKKRPAPLNKIFQILNFASKQSLFNRVKKLFAKNDKTIHFVEVKTIISNDSFHPESAEGFFPEERVDYKKQKKLIGLCQIWLEKNKFSQNYPYQIDVIGILVNQNSRNAKLHYFPNVVEDKY